MFVSIFVYVLVKNFQVDIAMDKIGKSNDFILIIQPYYYYYGIAVVASQNRDPRLATPYN